MEIAVRQTWLITGAGHGLGRSIAEAALDVGDRVVATAREPSTLDDLVSRFGDDVRVMPLDVTDEAQGQAAVRGAIDAFGSLDVLVNNAGYGESRPFEEMPSKDFRKLVETVFFGTVNLTRAALPVMRKQRYGLIMQISSIGGRFAGPGQSAYHAAKWAVGGFTDAVRAETAPFGVRLITLEPGAMRTGWGKRAYNDRPAIGEDYQISVGAAQDRLESLWGNEPIDPERFAALIVRLSRMQELPAHLVIGAHAIPIVQNVEAERTAEMERWRPVSESVEFGSVASIADAEPVDALT
jgi:NAD(P)-dependent dehydrogenase (short-subunit alcohol dehydrogenase family)